jgi:hypothetical protein
MQPGVNLEEFSVILKEFLHRVGHLLSLPKQALPSQCRLGKQQATSDRSGQRSHIHPVRLGVRCNHREEYHQLVQQSLRGIRQENHSNRAWLLDGREIESTNSFCFCRMTVGSVRP